MDAENKRKHLAVIKQSFKSSIELDNFSDKEKLILEKYGAWMQALADGVIKPSTKEQSHFVAVVNSQKNSVTEFEFVWKKYCQLVHQEKQNRILMLLHNKLLSYKQLQLVMDHVSEFSFSKDEIDLIRKEIDSTRPRSFLSPDSFAVYSNTDGQ